MAKTTLVQSVMLPLSKIEANRGQIVGLPKNPRVIRDAKYQILKKSIEEDPEMTALREILVVEYGDKYVIIGGNMRFRAMQDLGIKEAPCKVIPADTDVEKLKAYTIKDNAGFGEWDWDDLANEWGDEPLSDWGVDVWEAAEEEESEGGDTPEVAEDDFDEEQDPVICRCKRGDVWQLGNHRVMCGDSTSEQDVEKLRGGELADLVFTDPPYGVSIGDKNAALNSVQPSGRCTTNIENDTLSASDLYPILVKAMTNARKSCKSDASYYVTSPQGGELGLMMMMMKDAGLPVRHMLIWEKSSATFSLGRLDYDYQHEPIFYTWTEKHHNYRNGEYRTTIWKYDKPRKCDLHPTMKPVALVVNAIMDGTKEGDIVLDVFGGSGTSVIACEQTGRRCLTMELDPHYCDVIIARWEKLTGQTAKLLKDKPQIAIK